MKQMLKSLVRRVILKLRHSRKEQSDNIFLKDIFRDTDYSIGEFTYGEPRILFPNKQANLKIGKFCSIAHGVTIFLGGNHRLDWISTYPFSEIFKNEDAFVKQEGHPATKGDVIIGHDVWIGFNVTILSGVTIGNGAVIAAESVVSKDVGPYEVWGGNPARLIKKRFSEDKIEMLQGLGWWNWPIDRIKEASHLLCGVSIDFLIEKYGNNKINL